MASPTKTSPNADLSKQNALWTDEFHIVKSHAKLPNATVRTPVSYEHSHCEKQLISTTTDTVA